MDESMGLRTTIAAFDLVQYNEIDLQLIRRLENSLSCNCYLTKRIFEALPGAPTSEKFVCNFVFEYFGIV